MRNLAFCLVLLSISALVNCCEEGKNYRIASFFKQCNEGVLRWKGCVADWLTGESQFIPFQTYADHILHPSLGYRFYCRSRGRSYSFQVESCVLRDLEGVSELRIGERKQIRSANGRFTTYTCRQ